MFECTFRALAHRKNGV